MLKLIFKDIFKNQKLFIGTVISIGVTVGIIVACMNLIFGSTQYNNNGHRFDNVDIVITNGDEIVITYMDDDKEKNESENVDGIIPFTDSQIQRLEEQYDIIIDNTFYTKVVNKPSARLSGHNVSSMGLTNFELVDGNYPLENEVVLDQNLINMLNLSIGDTINLDTRIGENTYIISGVVNSNIDKVYEIQNYIFFNDDTADTLSLGVGSIGVITTNVKSVVDDLNDDGFTVYTGSKLNNAEVSSIKISSLGLTVIFITMGSVCLAISLFVISGTIQFSIRNRIRQFALLRVIGFSKGQVNKVISTQNLILSFVGSILGLALAVPLTEQIISLYIRLGVVNEGFVGNPNNVVNILVCLAMTVLVFFVSLLTARKSLKLQAMAAIKQEGSKNSEFSIGGLILGLILLAGSIAVLIFTPFYGGIGIGMGFCAVVLAIGSMLFLSPLLMIVVNWLLKIFTKTMHNSLGQVASANVLYKASKFSVAAISIAIIISINGVMVLNNFTYIDSSSVKQYELASEYRYITTNVHEDDLDSVEYYGFVSSSIVVKRNDKLNELPIIGVNIVHGDVEIVEGRSILNDNEMLISERQKRYEVGKTYTIWSETGVESTVKIVGKYKEEVRSEYFQGIMNDDFILENSYSNTYDRVFTNVEIDEALPHSISYYEENPSYDIQVAATLLMTIISFCLSLVALFNTFAVIMSVRNAEFNNLKIIGATKEQIIKMTLLETVIVVLTGVLIGVFTLAVIVGRYSMVNTGVFEFIINPQIFYGLILSASILGLIAGLTPSYITVKGLKQKLRVE